MNVFVCAFLIFLFNELKLLFTKVCFLNTNLPSFLNLDNTDGI
jgi:hypothetical protein